MAKKRRSAKQQAATRKLVALNKRRRSTKPKTRRTASKRRKSSKTNKPRKPSKSMAKRRGSSGKKSGFLGKVPLINNPTFKKAAAGVGTATIGAAVLSIIAPGLAANPIVKPVLALAGGDIVGLAAQVLSGGGLSQLTGGGNGGNGGNSGFA